MIPYMNVDLRSINLHYDQRMNWMLNNHQKITEERQNEKPNLLQKEKPQINMNQPMTLNQLNSRSVSLGVQTDSDLVQSYERNNKVQATSLISSFPPHPTMLPISKEEAAIRSLRASSNSMPTDYERNFIPRFPIDEHHLAQLNHPHHHMQTKTEPGTNGSGGTNGPHGPPYYGETDFDTNYYSKLMSAFLIQDCNSLRTLKDQAGNAVFPNSSHYNDGDGKTRVANGFDVRNTAYSLYNEASSLFSQNTSASGEGSKSNEGHTVNRKPNAILRLGGEEVTCEVCDKKFPHIWLLKIHSTKHTGRRLRTCELCSKAFVSAFGSGVGGRRRNRCGSAGDQHHASCKSTEPSNSYDARLSLYDRTAFPGENRNAASSCSIANSDTMRNSDTNYDRVTGLYRGAFPGDCNRSSLDNCDSRNDNARVNNNNNRSDDSVRNDPTDAAYNRVTSALYREGFTNDTSNRNVSCRSESTRVVNTTSNESQVAQNNIMEPEYSRANLYQNDSFTGSNETKDASNRINVEGMRYNTGQAGNMYERETFTNSSSNRADTRHTDCSRYNSNRNEITSASRSNVSVSDTSSLSPAPSTSSTTSMSLCSSSSPSASVINHINNATNNNNGLSVAAAAASSDIGNSSPTSSVTQHCDLCNRLFTAADRDDDLDSALSYGKIYTCDVCNRSYSTLGNLKQHKEKHYGEKNFVCEKCNKSFFTAGNLKQHLITHTGEKSFLCKLCNKTYSTSGNLRQHLLTHTGQKTNFCVICNRSFSTLGNLKQHMLTHFATNLYPCEVCKKSYSTLGNLKQHMLTHTGQKIFPCDKCDKTFTTLGNAKQHMIRHSGEKPYVCQTCSKSFFTLGNLKQHALTHSEEKLYKCDKCTKSFYTLSNLKQHSATHSDIKKTYVCEICSRSFSTFGNLKQHKLKHTLNIS